MGACNGRPGDLPTMRALMKKEEKVSYMMLFCALMLVKNSRATLEESVAIVPLVGRAKQLAGELVNGIGSAQPAVG